MVISYNWLYFDCTRISLKSFRSWVSLGRLWIFLNYSRFTFQYKIAPLNLFEDFPLAKVYFTFLNSKGRLMDQFIINKMNSHKFVYVHTSGLCFIDQFISGRFSDSLFGFDYSFMLNCEEENLKFFDYSKVFDYQIFWFFILQ